jgi:hypothetical protein
MKEYKILEKYSAIDLEREINEKAQEGWHVLTSFTRSDSSAIYAVLEREIDNPSSR